MNVFTKKLQSSNSCKSPSRPSILFILPNELIYRILNFLPALDLIPIYNITITSTPLNAIITNELIKRLEQNQLSIRLYFDQESRWRYALDMQFHHMVNTHSLETTLPQPPPLLHFVPKSLKHQEHLFYTSKLLRRPRLYKIILITTTNNNSNHQNLLEKSYAIDIKQSERPYYRAEMHTTNSLLTYSVSETPAHVTKARPGERRIQYLAFECDLSWLCTQPEPTIFNNKWFSISTTSAQQQQQQQHHQRTTPKMILPSYSIANRLVSLCPWSLSSNWTSSRVGYHYWIPGIKS